jgi:hypothetical protein
LSFNLSLTDKQKQAKSEVELPYMKAQDVGSGTIHYQLEEVDDFDEEDPDDDLDI